MSNSDIDEICKRLGFTCDDGGLIGGAGSGGTNDGSFYRKRVFDDFRKDPLPQVQEFAYERLNGGNPACPVLFVSEAFGDVSQAFKITDNAVVWEPAPFPRPELANWGIWNSPNTESVLGKRQEFSQLFKRTDCRDKIPDRMRRVAHAFCTVDRTTEMPNRADVLAEGGYPRDAPTALKEFPTTTAGTGFSVIHGFYLPPGAALEIEVVDIPSAEPKCDKDDTVHATVGVTVVDCGKRFNYLDTSGHVRPHTLTHGTPDDNTKRYLPYDWIRYREGLHKHVLRISGGSRGATVTSTGGGHWASEAHDAPEVFNVSTDKKATTALGVLMNYQYMRNLTENFSNLAVMKSILGDKFDETKATLITRYRFIFEPVETKLFKTPSEWFMHGGCFQGLETEGTRKVKGGIRVENRELTNWRPQSSVCDTIVSQYCELNLDDEECACFRERAKAKRDIQALGLGLPPQCFGGCAQTDRSYHLKDWKDESCNESICSSVIKLHGKSMLNAGMQDVVCANRKYDISSESGQFTDETNGVLASLPPGLDESDARGSGGLSNNTIVLMVLGGLFLLLGVLWATLYFKSRNK